MPEEEAMKAGYRRLVLMVPPLLYKDLVEAGLAEDRTPEGKALLMLAEDFAILKAGNVRDERWRDIK